MKKILSIVAVLFLSTSVFAQSQKLSDDASTKKSKREIANLVKQVERKSQKEFKSFVEQNFKTYDMDALTPDFKTFMQKTIKSNASYEVRKMALYMLYGEEYSEHADELGEPRQVERVEE